MESISAAQIKLMYGVSRKLGMDNDALHALVRNLTGKESVKTLTRYEGVCVINQLKRKAGDEEPGDRANKGQLHIIYGLARKLGWLEDSEGVTADTRLRAFCEKRYGVSHPRFLNETQTNNIIQAMRAMVKGNRGDRYARQS